jgi:hypothetical protein
LYVPPSHLAFLLHYPAKGGIARRRCGPAVTQKKPPYAHLQKAALRGARCAQKHRLLCADGVCHIKDQ